MRRGERSVSDEAIAEGFSDQSLRLASVVASLDMESYLVHVQVEDVKAEVEGSYMTSC